MPPPRRPAPIDDEALTRLALRYVERFATSRGKLARYLDRKLRERGWTGAAPPDTAAIAERMAALGYVDDRMFAEARASAMARRGLGARRIAGAFRDAGIGDEDVDAVAPAIADRERTSALTFARRRRIGPFADVAPDRAGRERALAAMLRAGHPIRVAKAVVALDPGDDPDAAPFGDG